MLRGKLVARRFAIVSVTTLGVVTLLFSFWWLLMPFLIRLLLVQGSDADWGPGP